MSMNGVFVRISDDEIRLLLATPREISALLRIEESRTDPRCFRLDKDWHALHWLLTGDEEEGTPPLNFILAGGTEIGDIDVGYGAARAFTGAEVRGIHAALTRIATVDLLSRYNGDAMSNLYPGGWDFDDEEAQNRHGLALRYDALKEFIAQTTDRQLGLCVFVY